MRRPREKTSAPQPERVSSLISTDGRQPFVPAASRKASLFRAYPFGSPFSRRNGRSSALIGAPRSSDDVNITRTKAACQGIRKTALPIGLSEPHPNLLNPAEFAKDIQESAQAIEKGSIRTRNQGFSQYYGANPGSISSRPVSYPTF
jgi:hypothetical protein